MFAIYLQVFLIMYNIKHYNVIIKTYLGKASFALSLIASMNMMPSKTACLTLAPRSSLGKSRQRSMSSLNSRATKRSLMSMQGFDFHMRNSVCTLGSISKMRSLHSFSQSLSRPSLSIGKGDLRSFFGESGEVSRPYFKLKCDGDLHQKL